MVLGSAIEARCGASIITKPILVLDLDVAPSRHGDGTQKAQRLWARFTEPAKAKLCGSKRMTKQRNYPQRVRKNILPLSVAESLPEAFEEWTFTDEIRDHEEPVETCQLCEQEQLRYHFMIRNALTKEVLWVGSQCILKFGLSVFEDGLRLSGQQAKKKLDRLTQQMRLDSCIKALDRLAEAENNEIPHNALDYYDENKCLTPKQAFVVLWRLQKNKIDHAPSFFKVSLQRQKYRDDLRDMEPSRVRCIWPALSSSQRRLAEELGHSAPDST